MKNFALSIIILTLFAFGFSFIANGSYDNDNLNSIDVNKTIDETNKSKIKTDILSNDDVHNNNQNIVDYSNQVKDILILYDNEMRAWSITFMLPDSMAKRNEALENAIMIFDNNKKRFQKLNLPDEAKTINELYISSFDSGISLFSKEKNTNKSANFSTNFITKIGEMETEMQAAQKEHKELMESIGLKTIIF